jgi:cysteine desulfurase/selenocysteine lyase
MAGRWVTAGRRAIDPSVRGDFPLLARQLDGRPLVYLDSAATSQKPRAVIEAMARFYEQHNANVHRGVHRLAEEATEALEQARAAVQRFLGADTTGEIIFTPGTTASINLVAQGWARGRLKSGDEILVTELEHHSNLIPWQQVARATGATLRFIPVSGGGELQLAELDQLLSERTRLFAFSHVSNALGTLLPAKRLVQAAHDRGAAVLIDAAQSAPHLPLDVRELGCDFLAFSAHKLLGPTGIGVLYARAQRIEEMEPVSTGGGMVNEVYIDRATWAAGARKLEAGTPPIAEAVGLHAAIDYLSAIGMDSIRDHERSLTARALARLSAIELLTLYGPINPEERSGVLSFNLRGVHTHDLAAFLDARGIAVRAGNHCAQPLMRKLGVAGTARASWHVYTLAEEIDALAEALGEAGRELR